MPAASLGHYASLSFVVIGRSEIINSDSCLLTPGFFFFAYRLPLTSYRLPFTVYELTI
jgi:hypothetical protein